MPIKSKLKRSWLKQRLIAIFKRNPCYKLIDYQGTLWKISTSAHVGDVVTVDLKEIRKQLQQVTLATNQAKILDDYQFLLCEEIETWLADVEYAKLLRGYRIVVVSRIVQLATLLDQIKADSNNEGLKRELVRTSRKMSQLIDKLEKSVFIRRQSPS